MTIHSDAHTFESDVTFSGNVTFSETPAEISLDNLTNLTGTGTGTFADLVATDDLTVGDDATIGGDLAVATALSCATFAVGSSMTVGVIGTAISNSVTLTGTALTVTGVNMVGLHDYVTLAIGNLNGSTVYRVASPVAGTLVKMWSNLAGALATGDATITSKIGSTAITDGVITITQAASAAGDIDSATPSAANVVVEGSDLNFTVGGTNSNNVGCTLTLKFLRSA